MTVHQHAVEVGTFAQYLRDLTARLDPGQGWFGVFTRRDPVGMRSCLDGVEIPPWDVVESLLADLAALHGAHFAAQVSVRAAALYSASASAHDRRPGGRQELVHRLELMIREQGRAAERLRTTGAAGGDPADPEALAWAHDDHQRASARCTELRKRLAAVTVPHPRVGADPERAPEPVPERVPGFVAEPVPAPEAPEPLGRSRSRKAAPAPAPEPRRKKPRGARFAGLEVDDEEETAYAPSPVPALPAPPSAACPARRPLRRRAGGGGGGGGGSRPGRPAGPGAAEAVAAAVGQLVRLRAEGRSGEAHVVLCEVAAWPAPRLPVLAVALYRAGLAADWTTLLWEASSLPPAGFAAAAGALAAAGRDEDCGLLLRQGWPGPPPRSPRRSSPWTARAARARRGRCSAPSSAYVRRRRRPNSRAAAGTVSCRTCWRRPARCRWSGSGT
ncbi:hypothetical protein [Streptomyces microflavus]|uniref:hypothetical protein n=1 Tax=Streptomyces microflavus TaxID=1919 RepID=UPI003B224304